MIILKQETNQQNFSIILHYLEEEFREILQHQDFAFAYQLLENLNNLLRDSAAAEDWIKEKVEDYFQNISIPDSVGVLRDIGARTEILSSEQLTFLGKVLILLRPRAIETLWPLLMDSATDRVAMLLELIVAHHAQKDLTPLENSLSQWENRFSYKLSGY